MAPDRWLELSRVGGEEDLVKLPEKGYIVWRVGDGEPTTVVDVETRGL